MEIRVYKDGEDKKLDLRGTSIDSVLTVDKFTDVYAKASNGKVDIYVGEEKRFQGVSPSDIKNFSGTSIESNASKAAFALNAILSSKKEVDSYVIGDDLSQKSSETIFTHNTAGTDGLGGRLIVDDDKAKVNVTRTANQGTTGLEVLVTGVSGSDLGSIVGKGANSNITRTIFTAQASTGQQYESKFTVHDRFEVEGEANFLDAININGNELSITDLDKVPASLGSAGQVLAVNSGATALEFVNQSGGSGGSGSSTLLGLTDTPSGFGSSGQVLVVNAGRTAMEFATPLQIGTTATTALAGNTLTITSSQALAINANSAKTSFPGFGTTAGTALEGDTSLFDGAYSSLTGIPSSFTPSAHNQAWTTITGTPTTISGYGITDALQLGTTSTTALAGDTTTITSAQASAITANTAKTSFPGFGTTSGTALEGDTALLQLGTTSTTALAGDTTTITSSQASAITANTAKTSFPGFGTTAGTALEGNTSLFDGSYTSLTSVPSTFTPSSHNHSISEITSLQTTLDGLIPYSGASSNVDLNSNALTGVSSITSSAALFGSSPANLRAFNVKGTGLNGRLSLQGGSGDAPGLEMTTDGNASRVLLRMVEVGTDGTSLQIFTEPDGGGIGKHLQVDDDGTLYVFPSGTSGSTAGDAGFKNNSGTMQFKNSSGSWTDIPSSGGAPQQTLEGELIDFVTRSTSYDQTAYEGEVVKIGSGSSMSFGQLRYMSAAGSPLAARWVNADADAESTSSGMLAIALGANALTDGMLVRGSITYSNTFTPGDILYVSLTEGEITNDISSFTTGDIVRIVGYAMSTGQIYFNPSPNFIELA